MQPSAFPAGHRRWYFAALLLPPASLFTAVALISFLASRHLHLPWQPSELWFWALMLCVATGLGISCLWPVRFRRWWANLLLLTIYLLVLSMLLACLALVAFVVGCLFWRECL